MKEILLPKVGQVIIISDYYKGERLTINQALPWLSFTRHDIQPRFVVEKHAIVTIGWKAYFLLWWLLAVAREAVWRLSYV